MEYRLQNDKTKFIPIETKKKFSVQLELFQKKTFPQRKVRLDLTNQQTNEHLNKNKKIDLKFLILTTFIQCNTIVQLTNYFSIIIIKNNACFFHVL